MHSIREISCRLLGFIKGEDLPIPSHGQEGNGTVWISLGWSAPACMLADLAI